MSLDELGFQSFHTQNKSLPLYKIKWLFLYSTAVAASLQSCPTLSNPVDCNPPGSSVHGFSRQEYWSGVPLLNLLTLCFSFNYSQSKYLDIYVSSLLQVCKPYLLCSLVTIILICFILCLFPTAYRIKLRGKNYRCLVCQWRIQLIMLREKT